MQCSVLLLNTDSGVVAAELPRAVLPRGDCDMVTPAGQVT